MEQVQPYLRCRLVLAWDVLDLFQQIRLADRRLVGLLWRRIPPSFMARIARRAERIDLSAPTPGGGRLIVARK